MAYRPDLSNPIPLLLLIPNDQTIKGVSTKTYPTIEQALLDNNNIFYGSFKTYGGTEKFVNGVYSIEDTATIDTWFRPDIKSDCRIVRLNDNAIFNILNEPEDIDQRHQFLKFKVKRIKGNA